MQPIMCPRCLKWVRAIGGAAAWDLGSLMAVAVLCPPCLTEQQQNPENGAIARLDLSRPCPGCRRPVHTVEHVGVRITPAGRVVCYRLCPTCSDIPFRLGYMPADLDVRINEEIDGWLLAGMETPK